MQSIYEKMWADACAGFRRGQFELDPAIDDPGDARRGLSLVIRPRPRVLRKFTEFLAAARSIDDEQYFYESAQIHTTVMTIVACSNDFSLHRVRVTDYCEVIAACLNGVKPFNVSYFGVTASPSCILAQGLPSGSGLQQLRESLRESFRKSGLQCVLDERYLLETAHCTLIRFRARPRKAAALLDYLQASRSTDFGQSRVCEMKLVFNDWYHRQDLVRELQGFRF